MASGIAGKLSGGKTDIFLTKHPIGKLINGLTQNWMGQMVTTMSVGLTQMLSMAPLAGSEVGMGRAWKSFGNVFWGEVMRAVRNPGHLDFMDSMTKDVREAGRMHGNFTDAPNPVARFVGKFAEYMDTLMVKTAFNAGFRYYMEVKRPLGMPSEIAVENAKKYGDYVSARTQAVFIKHLKPQMLQPIWMSHVMPFQNSVWASMNTLVRDGLMSKDLSFNQKLSRTAAFYATAVMVSAAIRQLKSSPGNIWEDALLTAVPVLGGISRFGGSTAGYIGEIQRIVVSPTRENVVRGITNIAAPVGTGQLFRTAAGLASMYKGEGLARSAVPMDQADPLEWLRAATTGYRGTKAYTEYVAERQSSKGLYDKFLEYWMDQE
jgi:hypothetical protein